MDLLSAVVADDVKRVQELYTTSRNEVLVRVAVESGSKEVLGLLITEASSETLESTLPLAVKKGDLTMVKMLYETLFILYGKYFPWEAMKVALERGDMDIIRYSAAYIRDDHHSDFLRYVVESSGGDLLRIKDLTRHMYHERQIESCMIDDFLGAIYSEGKYGPFIAILSAIFELLEDVKKRSFATDIYYMLLACRDRNVIILEKYLIDDVKIDPHLLAETCQLLYTNGLLTEVDSSLIYLSKYNDGRNPAHWRFLTLLESPRHGLPTTELWTLVKKYL